MDAGLRLDGLPALDLWDAVIEVLHLSKNTDPPTQQAAGNSPRKEVRSTHSNTKSKRRGNRDVDELSKVDHVVTNARSSRCEAQLYIFEGNEAVIKMIIKGRSPTMRHVSRTHRVALDWSFDKINLDPQKIKIKYVDTKNQLADMLTKSNFTRDELNHLLRLFNIKIFSIFSCIHVLPIISQAPCSKRAQDRRTEEELVLAKPRSACMFGIKKPERKSNPPRWIRVLHTARRTKTWVGILFSPAWETSAGQNQPNSQEWQRYDNPFFKHWETSAELCVSVQAQANLCEVSRTNLQGRNWTTTICNSQTIDTLRKSSRTLDRS